MSTENTAKYYLTTPIYYVNARPHIGHAYTTIVADVLARRHRALGEDTFFLTGTDEHGQKIERSAAAAGIDPQLFTDKVSEQFKSLWDRMGLTYDRYIRTTDECHKRGAQHLFSQLYERGFIYLDSYTGAYCVSDEAFVDASVGSPCPDCGRILETVTEQNFFFRLSAFQKPLLELIESDALIIENDARRNEVVSFLQGPVSSIEKDGFVLVPMLAASAKDLDKSQTVSELVKVEEVSYTRGGLPYVAGSLRDLSVSRSSFSWGIPVPEPAASIANQKHVIYVWLDALANYMTAIGYGSSDSDDKQTFEKFWPADLHLVGKEIIRFHCVYWPAFLLALNPELQQNSELIGKLQDKIAFRTNPDPREVSLDTHKKWACKWLPKSIIAHGWLLFDNSKMSKSKGNVVRTETILDAFGDHVFAKQFPESPKRERDLFAADVLRYFLLREIPFGQDGSFSFDAMVTRYNADLANGYGNLVSRTLNMISQYFDGAIPAPVFEESDESHLTPDGFDAGLLSRSATELRKRLREIPETDFAAQLAEIAAYIGIVDGFITANAPWKLAKDPDRRGRLATVLYVVAEAVRCLTIKLHAVCPFSTARVWTQLGLGGIEEAIALGELTAMHWGGLKPGTQLGALTPVFPRADKTLTETMIAMEENNSTPRPADPLKTAATPTTFAPTASSPLDPAAPPRALDEPSGELPVGGSNSATANLATTPSHTEAPASGPFASPASQTPITAGPADASPQITIDDFIKVELRIAQVLVAERIPKADKLLRLEVDLGYEKRQILSGIAEWYTPEDLIGRRIIVITNLAPRKMRGLESHGMLLAGSEEGGKPYLATVPEGVPIGTRLK
jgi:methionyl-tRNA synthetase